LKEVIDRFGVIDVPDLLLDGPKGVFEMLRLLQVKKTARRR
jgi:hypothetical protein